MKTRTLIFLAISAVMTLSFTFASVSFQKAEAPAKTTTVEQSPASAPVGGMVSEYKY